ncbi:ecto-ADP-ribosyltransferase 4 isoform X2 [Phocoena sinus]|uniref:ecto-ADP-ribosyltransferase 4 isoform X2 n=1 Tax=Phocoena sinus TaxID=42100 RepID=UPI0013C4C0CB|nr:ecto-ADP-ribosyltransferase 4 isoform X2 [Phocoena sinus]
MKLQGRRSAFNTNKCCPLTNKCRRSLLPNTVAPEVAVKIDFDLALSSFDDQYQGCSQQVMEDLIQGDYFTKEIESRRNYHRVWQRAHLTWLRQGKALPENMTVTHAVAILVYSSNDSVRSDFSRAMASAAGSPQQYKHSFHFKYLHYYLTTAIQLLRKEIVTRNDPLCYEVHHEVKGVYLEAPMGATIRFGQFLSASFLREEAQKFGDQTLFTILTCLGAPVQDFSLKKEVLVPPYELFEVVNTSYHPRGNWLQLQSAGTQSAYNCQLLKASSKKCIPIPVVIASLSFLTCVIISSKSRA